MKGSITIRDGKILALDTDTQSYVLLPNVLVQDGKCVLYKNDNHSTPYCIFGLTGDPIADTARKLRLRHGRNKQKREHECMQADMIENRSDCYLHAQHAEKHQTNVSEKKHGAWNKFLKFFYLD